MCMSIILSQFYVLICALWSSIARLPHFRGVGWLLTITLISLNSWNCVAQSNCVIFVVFQCVCNSSVSRIRVVR